MKIHYTLVCILSLVMPLCFAQDTPKERTILAGELVDSLQIEQGIISLLDQAKQTREKILDDQNLSADARQKKLQQIQLEISAKKQAVYDNSLKPAYIKIYSDSFSDAELRDILSFFKSSAGRAWIAKQTQIQNALVPQMRNIEEQMRDAVMKVRSNSENNE